MNDSVANPVSPTESKPAESNVIIDKSLINNKFESYQLRFDSILTNSKRIDLVSPHEHIRVAHRIPNIAKLKHLLNKNYLFFINNIPFYYDVSGIFRIDQTSASIHQIHAFSKDITVVNLSVIGCYDTQTSSYYFIASHSHNKISVLKYDLQSKRTSIVFDDTIKEIAFECMIQNGYYSEKRQQIFCSVLSWIDNKQNDSFHPIIHVLSFDTSTKHNTESNVQTLGYTMHARLQGAKHYFTSVFDAQNDTFWMISNGQFRCTVDAIKTMDKCDEVHEPNRKKRKVEEYDDYDCVMIECFDVRSMNVIHTINFHDCVSSKIMSINWFVNDNDNDDDDESKCNEDDVDRVLCVIGCELSEDMMVFKLLDNTKSGYGLKHETAFPGLSVIAASRRNNREILIDKQMQNTFIVQYKQYISSFANPKDANKGIQDSLQLKHNEEFVGTMLLQNKLYCLTNFNFYSFLVTHVKG